MLAPGTILGERYEIIRKIGAGGMSIVYKAKCNKLQRFVAIKVLREEFVKDESFVKKFRAEALSAASLSHPNIVGIYDVGSDQDLHYIVMELVEGTTLKEVIEQEGPMPSAVVLEYGMQILSAIRHAHRKQIIHRDIKPQNILVTNDKVLKVADFGIAHAVDSSTLVATGNAIGSVHYFSPEQAKGKYVNETSDLYSCGIVLFELATKRLPFEAESHVSIALKHINEEIPRPTTFNATILPALEQIILKATDKRQELRYQSAEDMMKDLKSVLENPKMVLKKNEDVTENTILLTEEQTNQIRRSEKPVMPISNVNQSIYEEESRGTSTMLKDDIKEDEEEDSISPMYKWLVTIGGVLATFVIVGIASFMIFFKPAAQKDKFIAVPQVVGKTVEEAEQFVQEDKLIIEVVEEKETEEALPGTILNQTPGTQEKIKPEGIIQVVVAKEIEMEAPKEVTVPEMLGVDAGEAQRMLQDRKLVPKVTRDYDEQIELGKVISHYPEANATVKEGDVITLTISNGPKTLMTAVPNLISLTQADAVKSLKRNNLTLGKVTPQEHESVEKGRIIEQSILANTEIQQGAAVNVVVSTGKPVEEVPDVPVETPEEIVPGEPIPEDDGTTEVPKETKTYTINLPQGSEKEEYHVFVTLENNGGSTSTIYDGIVEKANFPFSVTAESSGDGVIVTRIDGTDVYRDPF